MNCVLSKGIPVISSSVKYGVFRNILVNNYIPIFSAISCSDALIHSSACLHKYQTPGQKARFKALDKVDWLPFPWTRRAKHNPFEDSGDIVKELEYDPSWPKPDFELSEELKTANGEVKHMFSLATASKNEIKEAIKRRMLDKIQRHPNDLESIEVKIALRTLTIRSIFQHMKELKKERKGGRFVLDILIKKRNRSLKTLRKIDRDRFEWLCEELKLKYIPKTQGGQPERYTRKWDLRQLTKEYCTKIIDEKKEAYHEELKQQQADFLKEKEEILTWIEKEEKELANLNI